MAKRRANVEGRIRKRKDGRWEGRYTAGQDPNTGKTICKNELGKTKAEVKEKLKKAIADSQQLDMTRAKTYTVQTWIKLWYEVYAEPRLREKTKDYYLDYIDNHIIHGLGNVPLDKLTTIQIQKFYNELQKNGRIQRYEHIELKNGVDVKILSSAPGHYSAGFTLSTYTHATVDMKRDAADTIGSVISQTM